MTTTPEDRRRDQRITPKGTAIVHVAAEVYRGRISDLSSGGLSLVTASLPSAELVGGAATISVRLDAGDAKWFEMRGQVERIGPGWLALRLDEVPGDFGRMVEEAVSASRYHDRRLSVVLVDSVRERRDQMTLAFRNAGCIVVDVATPLEAIVRLGELDFEPDVIAIGDSLPITISDELRRFVDTTHPGAILVTIGESTIGPIGIENWLSSESEAPELAARVRNVLAMRHPR